MGRGWLDRVPVLRTYPALREAREQLAATKEQLRQARAERDRARSLAQHPISHGRFKELLGRHAASYRAAEPYPHVVLDDLFDERLLHDVLAEFTAMDRSSWHYTERSTERKYSTEDFQHFGPAARALISHLNAAPFMSFLERLTGIAGLMPDPYLRGGGLHEIRRDGSLGVHADFNYYERLRLYRRLNVLIYLNEGWSEDWGGDLELWDRSGTRCVRRIAPLFNRTVVFDTSNRSYHGHPRPLACPPERSRKSVALYYYTVDAPAGDDPTPHTTMFVASGT